MIDHKYGSFQTEQFNEYIKQLHKKIHWLLLYKDPKMTELYPEMTSEAFKKYFDNVMCEISGLNDLLFYPPQICAIMCLLQGAILLTEQEDFDFSVYRKRILDAHMLIDKIANSQGGGSDDKL